MSRQVCVDREQDSIADVAGVDVGAALVRSVAAV